MFEKNNLTRSDSIVTYDDLSNDQIGLSHFEVAYLASLKAIEIIRSASYLKGLPDQGNNYKPPVAVVALRDLCEHPEKALEFKSSMIDYMFNSQAEDEQFDEYNVDAGHLPENSKD
jgi:hypothetical protein